MNEIWFICTNRTNNPADKGMIVQEKEKAKAKGKKGGSRRERSKTMKKVTS